MQPLICFQVVKFARGLRRKTFDFTCSWRLNSTSCADKITRRGPYSAGFTPIWRRKISCNRCTIQFSCTETISREGHQVSVFYLRCCYMNNNAPSSIIIQLVRIITSVPRPTRQKRYLAGCLYSCS